MNLESSGRELESIVVGEIQKAYNAYVGVLKREADEAEEAVEGLSIGPLAIAKDYEWSTFVDENDAFVDPRVPVRKFENITYQGKDEPAAAEVKAGMLERKSKYLKSYTPGWYVSSQLQHLNTDLVSRYVLSATHLHEFKSPDRLNSQTPVMSLPLADQKLGSRSSGDSTSHKFMLKGRQSGGIHKSHAWVFRAESYDTMMAWYNDIKNLTEKTGIERDAFIRRTHARSLSGGSHHRSGSVSEGSAMDEDEADQVPYSAAASQVDHPVPKEQALPQRPKPGGRFPSNLNVHTRDSQIALAPSSPSENSGDRDIVAAAADLPGSGVGDTAVAGANIKDIQPISPAVPYIGSLPQSPIGPLERHESKYGDWMAPVTSSVASKPLEEGDNAPMLQSEHFEASASVPKAPVPTVTPSAQAAAQLSALNPPSAVTIAGVGTASTADSLASTPTTEKPEDPVSANQHRLRTVESAQVKVPGDFPPSLRNSVI